MNSIKFEINTNNLSKVVHSIGTSFYIDVRKISDTDCMVELTPTIRDEEKNFKDIMYAIFNIGSVISVDEITFIY